MPLQRAPYWTDLYYKVAEHYFWRPQDIGRKSDPDRPSQPWAFWKAKLESQETPLNHILDFLFHVAPQELLDQTVSALLERAVSGLELVEPAPGTLDENVVQPDIIVTDGRSLIFVEMKVDSRSSVDQFAKYLTAAHAILKDEPKLNEVDLVVLGRTAEHEKVWATAKKLGLNSSEAVRALAIRGLEGDESVWKQAGVKRYLRLYPESRSALVDLANNIGLHLADYVTLEGALRNFAQQEDTVERLVSGILAELRRRALVA